MNYDVDDDLREAKGNCVWCVLVSIYQNEKEVKSRKKRSCKKQISKLHIDQKKNTKMYTQSYV